MGDIDVDFFRETLKQLIKSSKVRSIMREKHQLESLEEEIKYMRGFLKVTEKKRNKHAEVMNLVRKIKDVVCEAENIIELFVVQAFKAKLAPYFLRQHPDDISLDLESVKKNIKTLTAKIKQIFDENMYDINGVASKKLEHSFFKSEDFDSTVGSLLYSVMKAIMPSDVDMKWPSMAYVVGMLEGGYPVGVPPAESLSFLQFFGQRRMEVSRIEAHNVQNGSVLLPQANAH
ncbi:hypothetical protein RHMOL_Rhmol02G0081400 [Rhododendron molle]|uniref:Uncharacterized protein n=1 Tax=Rhododendron molle TaxID=49168 RepID=A0ACC0PP79_RHOML|nr:hypothetical protein RHMOL_Rhmol02G0081400 [Rhododendron molle]